MPQRVPVETSWAAMRGSAAKSAASNFFVGGNCHSSGPRRSPSSITPGLEELLDRFAGLGELAAMGRVARCLDREDEAVRHLARPFAEGRRCLGAIERAVDLDRGETGAAYSSSRVFGRPVGVEHAAPRREGPAADAEIDASQVSSSQVSSPQVSSSQVLRRVLRHCRRPSPNRVMVQHILAEPSLASHISWQGGLVASRRARPRPRF